MNNQYEHNLIKVTLCAGLLLLLILLPFSLYGQDGYILWFPIIAEYLHGDSSYHASEVIFQGQNLASIYGELPFWKLFRMLGPPIKIFLNATHWSYVCMAFILSISIVKGVKKNLSSFDIYVLFLLALLSPVAINRVMAGHLNLLFGTLPLFVFVSLIFNKSKIHIGFCIFCIWCALSTQAFQVLAYHIFYLPLLICLFLSFETDRKRYVVSALIIFIVAFLLNFPNLKEMYTHAVSSDNLRGLDSNVVYSYLTSSLSDLIHFLGSGLYPEILNRSVGLYHEISYPVGAFLLLSIFGLKDKKIWICFFLSFGILFLFCMNIPPFNFLSELPLIRAFRVPQRVFMPLSLFLPLWVYARADFSAKKGDYVWLVSLVLAAQWINYFEVIAFAGVAIFLFYKKYQSQKYAIILSLACLFTGTVSKIEPSFQAYGYYLKLKESLLPLLNRYDVKTLRNNTFYFETSQPVMVNYVAQSMGINTVEGYGHPPSKLLLKFKDKTGLDFPATTNIFYFDGVTTGKDNLLKEFGVKTIVEFDLKNNLMIRDLVP